MHDIPMTLILQTSLIAINKQALMGVCRHYSPHYQMTVASANSIQTFKLQTLWHHNLYGPEGSVSCLKTSYQVKS